MEDNVMALRQENTGSGAAQPVGRPGDEDARHGTILPPAARRSGPGVAGRPMSGFDAGQRPAVDCAGVRRATRTPAQRVTGWTCLLLGDPLAGPPGAALSVLRAQAPEWLRWACRDP